MDLAAAQRATRRWIPEVSRPSTHSESSVRAGSKHRGATPSNRRRPVRCWASFERSSRAPGLVQGAHHH